MKNNKKYISSYEIIMAFLSLTVVFILIIDLSGNVPPEVTEIFNIGDKIIWIIFSIDYFYRFFTSENKLGFLKDNIIDLITIIPFSPLFQTARLLKLIRLFKAIKVFRAITLLLKFRNHIGKFLKTNNFHHVLLITLTTLLMGALGIFMVEGFSFGNAIWWSFVTITTVGYGDLSPTTPAGRIIAALLMIVGIGFVSILTGTIATFFLKQHTKSFKHETIDNIISKIKDFDTMTVEDINYIHKTLLALKEEKEMMHAD